MEKVGLTKPLLEKAEPIDHAGPTPAAMTSCQHFDFKHIAWLGAVDPDGAGKRMDASAIDGQKLRGRHTGPHLSAAGIHALNLHFIAWLDV